MNRYLEFMTRPIGYRSDGGSLKKILKDDMKGGTAAHENNRTDERDKEQYIK
jgi:hypothetical protein